MTTYKLVNSVFEEVPDPTDFADESDVDRAMHRAGYSEQVSSGLEAGDGAEVALWVRDEAPRFYIDITGSG